MHMAPGGLCSFLYSFSSSFLLLALGIEDCSDQAGFELHFLERHTEAKCFTRQRAERLKSSSTPSMSAELKWQPSLVCRALVMIPCFKTWQIPVICRSLFRGWCEHCRSGCCESCQYRFTSLQFQILFSMLI